MITPQLLEYYRQKDPIGWPRTASDRLRSAKAAIAWEVRNTLLGRNKLLEHVPTLLRYDSLTLRHNGTTLRLALEPDDPLDEDSRGFKVDYNRYDRVEGWGREGMDNGEYVHGQYVITFEDARVDYIKYAPPLSKQMKYEWASRQMQHRAEYARKWLDNEYYSVHMSIECLDTGALVGLGGIELGHDSEEENVSYHLLELICEIEDEIARVQKVA